MGTRASFWIGDPRQAESEWVGCKSHDTYPENPYIRAILRAKSEEQFREAVRRLSEIDPEDFDTPEQGWPFPWVDDIFLTDYTYAYFNGNVWVTQGPTGFRLGWGRLPSSTRNWGEDDRNYLNIKLNDKYKVREWEKPFTRGN